jgi:hypothetical protein
MEIRLARRVRERPIRLLTVRLFDHRREAKPPGPGARQIKRGVQHVGVALDTT